MNAEMQLEQLANSLPNGFHDAELEGVSIDYVSREATLRMQLLVGDPDAQSEAAREAYRGAELQLSGLLYLVIEAPDSKYKYAERRALRIDAGRADEKSAPKPPIPLADLPAGVSAYWFFVDDWNSLIHVAAMDARLRWI